MSDLRLPTIRDPRKAALGSLMTRHDVLTNRRERWTPLYKAIVTEAVRAHVLTPEEACEQFSLTVDELRRWIELIETRGVRALTANHFVPNEAPTKVESMPTIDSGRLFIDFAEEMVRIDGVLVHLTPYQFKLLSLLIYHAPNTVSREQVYSHLYEGGSRRPAWKILDVMICKMREKLGPSAIETVWGRGWRWKGVQ